MNRMKMNMNASFPILCLATLSAVSSAFHLLPATSTVTRHPIQDDVPRAIKTKLRLVPSSSFENNGNGNDISNSRDDYSAAATTTSATTLIATFPTKGEEHQNNFINSLQSSLMPILAKEPGFRSCQIYKSIDGDNVVLWEQWQSQQQCQDSYNPSTLATSIRTSLKFVLEIDDDTVDRRMYNTVATHHGRNDDAIFAAAAASGIGGGSPTVSKWIQMDQFIATTQRQSQQLSQSVWDYIRNKKPNPSENHSATSSVYQSSDDDGQRVTAIHQLLLHDDSKEDFVNPVEQQRLLDKEYQHWESEKIQSAHRLYSLVSSHEAVAPEVAASPEIIW